MSVQKIFYTKSGNNNPRKSNRVTLSSTAILGVLLLLFGFWAGLFGLVACQGTGTSDANISPTPGDSVTIQLQPSETPTLPLSTPTIPAVITLTIWTAPDYSPLAEGPAGEEMRQFMGTFDEAQPGIGLEYFLKKPQGKGGLLDLLLTASSVAPDILPDLILLEPHALRDAARAGLVQPLDDLLSLSLQQDLFPFALKAGRIDGRLQGVPFQADLVHLLYNTNKVESPPLTWTDVLTRPDATYLFPAGGQNGLATDSFLIHYLGTGASLFDELGQLKLDQEAMTAVLDYYAAGIQAGIIPTTVLDLETSLDTWPIYLEAKVAMTEIPASHYLANRELLQNTAYAAIPGQTGQSPTVSQGWMIAIVTKDAYRQEASLRLLEWWLGVENNTNWNLAAGTFPVRRSAYEYLGEQDAYFSFLAGLLESARAYPLSPAYREVAVAWQMAIESVLTGEQTPGEAAAQVMTTLGQ